jgi:prevent-host-death family protein
MAGTSWLYLQGASKRLHGWSLVLRYERGPVKPHPSGAAPLTTACTQTRLDLVLTVTVSCMTVNVNIHEAKTHLSRLLEQVAAGERVVISKAGTPIADLVPHRAATVLFGGLKGEVVYDDQAFGIDPDIQQMFYGPEAAQPGNRSKSGQLGMQHGDAAS